MAREIPSKNPQEILLAILPEIAQKEWMIFFLNFKRKPIRFLEEILENLWRSSLWEYLNELLEMYLKESPKELHENFLEKCWKYFNFFWRTSGKISVEIFEGISGVVSEENP